ncbi:MAG: phosphodiester glycosidase family protein [Betaproteobacteria bacterium]|nr:phosphodiester glycosidase family protein [Betaproteobacteria bacterium]
MTGAGRAVALCLSLGLTGTSLQAQEAAQAPASPPPPAPYRIERFSLPGPVAGVLARVDLTDPRVSVEVALTDDTDPDGDGPCTGQLDLTSAAAKRRDYAITLNASFFAAPKQVDVLGHKVRYFVGNCTWPVGWHMARGKLVSKPGNDKMRAALIVHTDGRLSIDGDLAVLPKDARHVVSGNLQVLKDGEPVKSDDKAPRHPRSVVGLTQDRKTLILVAIDGRQGTAEESPNGIPHSRGTTNQETGELMKRFGAHDAVNLDGGGSTAMVVKDPRTGAFSVANRPSDQSTLKLPVLMERPVADVIGIAIDWQAAPPSKK